jgi:predicted nuclease with RNAse H fold
MQGTTAVAYEEKGVLQTALSEKGKDADRWLFDRIDNIQPHAVCIDAPLSLLGVYTNSEGYTDYIYRQCNSELGASSPMFISGLTVRAMKFADQLHQ